MKKLEGRSNSNSAVMKYRPAKIRISLQELEARRQLALRETEAQQRRVLYALGRISRKVVSYPACPQVDMSTDEFRQKSIDSRRFARTAPIKVASMRDGVGIVFITQDILEDRLHKLMLPITGEAEYSRYAFNVDCQKIPSANIEATGVVQMAANHEIYPSLNYCMGALAVESSNGWTNAYK